MPNNCGRARGSVDTGTVTYSHERSRHKTDRGVSAPEERIPTGLYGNPSLLIPFPRD